MAHERVAKRMDDAVESSWLRGLRTQQGRSKHVTAAQMLLASGPRAKKSLGKLDRTVAAGLER